MHLQSTPTNSVRLTTNDREYLNRTICADDLIEELLEGVSGRILWGIIQIILMALGNIGNLLTLVVLNRRLMRKSGINTLLQGLAINDIVAPTIACIPHIIYYYGRRDDHQAIHFLNAYVMPLATGATFCSNWIVVTITSFRLLIVVKPLSSQIYCTRRNEKRALVIIGLCSVVSILPYYHYRFQGDAQNILKVVSVIVSLLGPWLTCVTLWIVLIRIVNREISTKRCQAFILHSEIVAQRLKSKSRMTKMVLIICFSNIVCQLPVLILTIFGLTSTNPCGYFSAMAFACLLFVSNLLLIINHSVNFFIYSLTNCKFRHALKMMCRRCDLCCHRHVTRQQLLMNVDEHRRSIPEHKYECHLSSHSKSRESPRLLNTLRSKHSSRPNWNRSERIFV